MSTLYQRSKTSSRTDFIQHQSWSNPFYRTRRIETQYIRSSCYRVVSLANHIHTPVSGRPSRVIVVWKVNSTFQQLADEQTPDAEQMKAFRDNIKALHDELLERADVVVCTMASLSQTCIYQNVKPTVIWIDEASKITEPHLMPAFTRFTSKIWVLMGDSKQMKPLVLTTKEENCFAPQLRLSAFHRLINIGHPSTTMSDQQRMHPSISSIANKVFYDETLSDSPAVIAHDETSICFLSVHTAGRFSVLLSLHLSLE